MTNTTAINLDSLREYVSLMANEGLAYIEDIRRAAFPQIENAEFKDQLWSLAIAGKVQLASADMGMQIALKTGSKLLERTVRNSALTRGASVFHCIRA